jgi:hypothetical protein
MTEITDRPDIPSKSGELVFQVSKIGDYNVALILHQFLRREEFHGFVKRHSPQIDRRSRGRSKRGLGNFIKHVHQQRTRSI